jgi:hypothetical protein
MTLRLKILIGILVVLTIAFAADWLLFSKNEITLSEKPHTLNNQLAQSQQNSQNSLPPITDLLPPTTEFSEILKRPLFTQARKAIAITTTPRTNNNSNRATNTDQPPQFIIVGVAIKPDGGSVLIKKSRQEMVRVLVGDEIDGWQVDKLDPKFVTMSKEGESWQIPVGEQ